MKHKETFQRKVIKHLQEKGFNCAVQPDNSFPEIVAWRPFINEVGQALILTAQQNLGGMISNKDVVPFFISLVVCKSTKYLNKKEKKIAEKLLIEGKGNVFLIAYEDKKKLEFREISLQEKTPQKSIKPKIPSYLG